MSRNVTGRTRFVIQIKLIAKGCKWISKIIANSNICRDASHIWHSLYQRNKINFWQTSHILEKVEVKPPNKKATTLAPLIDTRIHKSDNTVVLSPLNAENNNENDTSSSRYDNHWNLSLRWTLNENELQFIMIET